MRTLSFLFIVVSLLIFSSCSSDGPDQVAVNAVKSMVDKDFEKLLKYIAIPESLSGSEIKEYREQAITQFKRVRQSKNIYKQIDEHGGADKIRVVKNYDGNLVEYLNEEKDRAKVYIEVICSDGVRIDLGNDVLILQDGTWRIQL